MPVALGTFETPLSARSMQQIAMQFSANVITDDAPPVVNVALAGGGVATLQVVNGCLHVSLVCDDPQIIAEAKKLIEGYFAHALPDMADCVIVWTDGDA